MPLRGHLLAARCYNIFALIELAHKPFAFPFSFLRYVHWYIVLSTMLGFNQSIIWRAFLLLYFTFSAFVCVIVRHGINQIIQADIYLVPVFSLWAAFFMPPMNIDFQIATKLPKDKIVNWAFTSFMGPLVLNIIQVSHNSHLRRYFPISGCMFRLLSK